MRKTHKLLSLFLAALMVLTSVLTFAVGAAEPAEPTTWWSDNAATAFAGGDGTQGNPYKISSPAELAYFANFLEGGALNGRTEKTYFELTADVDMSAHQWKPIGYTKGSGAYGENTLYNAEFDGGNFTISGVKLSASKAISGYTYDNGCALFTKIDDATIKNLKLKVKIVDPVLTEGTYMSYSTTSVGDVKYDALAIEKTTSGVASLVGCAYGNSVIDNVTAMVDVDVNGTGADYYYAGLVAITYEGGTKITNCATSGTMDITTPAGTYTRVSGVLGRYYASIIDNVINEVDINVVAGARAEVGGVISATQTGPRSTEAAEPANDEYALVNKGDINVTVGANSSFVGGVIGFGFARKALEKCLNEGNITVTNSTYTGGTGGIIGYVTNTANDMIGSKNVGTVKLIKTAATGTPNIGGLVGQIAESGAFTDCVNEGSVIVEIADVAADVRVGGLVGELVQGRFYTCENKAPITVTGVVGSVRVGGLVGNIRDEDDNILEGCINRGAVVLTDSVANGDNANIRYLGGLAGNVAGPKKETAMKDCVNYASVTHNARGASVVGGVAGNISSPTTTIENCDNYGAITVENLNGSRHRLLAGVLGQMNTGSKLVGCDNNGTVWQKNVVMNANATAGIVGTMSLSAEIEKCINNGEVILTVAESGAANNRWVGGIAAQISAEAKIVECINNANITVSGPKNGTTNVAGIVGQATGLGEINTCINNGNVTTTYPSSSVIHAAGIVGYGNASVNYVGCINTGNIVTTANGTHYNGGIIGEIVAASAANAKAIIDCMNTGAVTNIDATGNNAAAGIVARTGTANVTDPTVNIKNCVNLGVISQSSLSGGIVGYTAAATVTTNYIDVDDFNMNGSKKDPINVVLNPYTVNFENCVSLGSGTTYSIVGSNRASKTNFKNCFGDTEYPLSYYNQNATYYVAVGAKDVLYINGEFVEGNDVKFTPDTCMSVELETLDKASIRFDSAESNTSAIRFDSYITKKTFADLEELTGVTFELGTMIAPTMTLKQEAVVGAYDKMAALDLLAGDDEKLYFTYKYTASFLDPDAYDEIDKNKNYYFAGVLDNIPEDSYGLEFSAIAYLTVKSGDFEFTFYADYDETNENRQRSVAQVAALAFEDRVPEEIAIGSLEYKYKASAENECYLGEWSIYSDDQLGKLKAYCAYENTGVLPEGLHINGVALSEYQIVYAQSPIYKKYGSNTGKTLIEDLSNVRLMHDNGTYVEYGDVLLGAKYDYDYQSAVRLQQLIKEKYGVELPVVEDVATEFGKYEILVGLTNRHESQSKNVTSLAVDKYLVKLNGSKLIVCGGAYGTTWHAIDALEELFGKLDSSDKYNLKLAGDLSGYYKLQKVACIGDSITRGSQALPDGSTYGGIYLGAPGVFGSTANSIYFEQFLSYPANLPRLMWKDAVIYNFGRGASTARNFDDSNYYAGSVQWRNCLAASADDDIDFDLVFFMHGTNDAGRGVDSIALKEFTAEHKKMMDEILKGSPDAQFVFNSVPHLFDGTGANRNEGNEHVLREYVKVMAQNFLDEGYKTYYYSMSDFQKNNLINEGKSPCVRDDFTIVGNIDSLGEKDIHSDYYNINTPCTKNEGTHPNFRGYNKMADGVAEVVNYILFGGEKPQYMFDLVPPAAPETPENPETPVVPEG